MEKNIGYELINDLNDDPYKFESKGKSQELLECYFDGFPVDTLRPLLASQDERIQGVAIWIASELGEGACALLDDAVRLISSPDVNIRYGALEVIFLTSEPIRPEAFVHVIMALADEDPGVRVLVMRLVACASNSQIAAAIDRLDVTDLRHKVHFLGLSTLHDMSVSTYEELRHMMDADDALERKYGALYAKRFSKHFPEALQYAAASSDTEIRDFASEMLNLADLQP